MELTERKKKVLRSVVDLYIRTAEPVGSKAITELPDMKYSSATIRNEMAELTTMGYLEQPHSDHADGGGGQSGHFPGHTVKNREKTTSAADNMPIFGVSATGKMRVTFLFRYSAFPPISRRRRSTRSSCRQQMSPAR